MYWIIIGIIIAVLVIGIASVADSFSFGYLTAAILLGFSVGYLGAYLCSCSLVDNPANCEYEITKVGLVALNGDSVSTGQFFIGRGQLSNKAVYYYLSGNEEDGFRQFCVNAKDCYIKYSSSDYYVEIKKAHCKADIERWTIPLLFNTFASTTYTFYVPEGSITAGFTTDFK